MLGEKPSIEPEKKKKIPAFTKFKHIMLIKGYFNERPDRGTKMEHIPNECLVAT